MSVISIPPEVVDMRDVGFLPKLDEDNFRPRKKLTELIVVHESGEPLREAFVTKVGRTAEQILAEVKKLEAQNMFRQSEDWEKIRLLEKRTLPEAFIARVKGEKELKELNTYIMGEQRETNGVFQTISEAHARTWCQGHTDLLGNTEIELDMAAIRKNFEESGKFSKITECSWAEMKQMR